MKRALIFLTLFLMAGLLFAQKKESLAMFPFTGGNASDGTAIVSSLSRQRPLRDAFNKVTLVTQNTIAAMNFEQRFQRNSGLTDADTIFELGKQLNASHVIAGYITKLGDRNLVIVSIMDVESLQQIAGDYCAYRTIEEIDDLIPTIAQKLAAAVPKNTSALTGLSVPPFNIAAGVNQTDAMVLAQILSCDLANSGKYAILPRTDSLDKIMEEQRRQRTGATDQERIKRLGEGRNAKYVLSGSVEKLGNLNKLAVDILDIVDGSLFGESGEERYTSLSQGVDLMPKLAAQVTGGVAPALVRINGGTFTMGSPANEPNRDRDEGPQHQVTVSSFYIGKYEVTQREYQVIMGTNRSEFEGDNLPVEMVSWFDAVEYCNKRSQREGLTPAYTISGSGYNRTVTWNRNANGYRLPTEAEWEYACRAGTTTAYNTGASISDITGWYKDNSGDKTHPVGQKPANAWGLHDMHGNVLEWCWDWRDKYDEYPTTAQTDPDSTPPSRSRSRSRVEEGPPPSLSAPDLSVSGRVYRGGGWYDTAQYVRSAVRFNFTPTYRNRGLGFRVARNGE